MSLTTLNIIISDLMDIIRGGEVVRTEKISEKQVEVWVHQYRALLIKRDLDKGNLINPDYLQTIDNLLTTINSNGEYETDSTLPNTVFRSKEDGYMWIGDTDGKEYQYMTEQRTRWQQHRKYVSDYPYVYLLNNKLISNYSGPLRVKAVWENPMEVAVLNNPTADLNFKYPIPVIMIPTLKEMILKGELGIESNAPSDEKNDGVHEIR